MGLAIAQGISSANAAGEALADRWSLEGRTTYTRLQLAQLIKTDPFSGGWLEVLVGGWQGRAGQALPCLQEASAHVLSSEQHS